MVICLTCGALVLLMIGTVIWVAVQLGFPGSEE